MYYPETTQKRIPQTEIVLLPRDFKISESKRGQTRPVFAIKRGHPKPRNTAGIRHERAALCPITAYFPPRHLLLYF